MDGRRFVLVPLVAVLAAVAAGCGDERPFRVGVMVDCQGLLRAFGAQMLAGAELPFLERGAQLRGRTPEGGITPAHIGGRRVEFVRGCSEGGEYTTVIAEARRLVEVEHVDAVVGSTWPGDEIVLRQVAMHYPHVTFVAVVSGPQELTLGQEPGNLFRVAPSFGQAVAGLATYAYGTLGWRRAAVVAEDWEVGWGEAAAFVAEFCALGGRVVVQRTLPPAPDPTPDPALVTTLSRVDGVAVLAGVAIDPTPLVRALSERLGDPRRLVAGPYMSWAPGRAAAAGNALDGVAATAAPPGRSAAWMAYADRFRRVFPGLAPTAPVDELTVSFYQAVEATLTALERADGSTLMSAFATLRMDLPLGPIRIDGRAQAVVSTSIVRFTAAGSSEVATFRDIDETLGGLLTDAEPPSAAPRACRHGSVPAFSARALRSSR
jgi:branched-chain amino acid transport system substrate-binding protein